MTEEPREEKSGSRPEWIEDAEEALDRVGDALRSAWEETRESRMSALGSAKQAAKQLGEAIDRGVEAARTRWQAAEPAAPSPQQETTSQTSPDDGDDVEED